MIKGFYYKNKLMSMSWEELRERLVEHLMKSGYIKTKKVKNAMLKVPRENFVSEGNPYEDTPLPIPGIDSTISAPHN